MNHRKELQRSKYSKERRKKYRKKE